MAEWTADDARWRLNADYPDDQRWVNAFERVKDDLDHALTELTETRLRAEVERAAWEGERRALMAVIEEAVEELSDHAMQMAWESVSDCHHWDLMVKLKAATARPTAPAVEG